MKVTEKAPAKINLSLDVLNKREDGFHEVKMVMTTIDLSDRIECEELPGDEIRIFSTASFVPEDQRNFAYQAADIIKSRYGIKRGVMISITKEIPVAAGLAGGSSDGAATIRALNRLWKLNMSQKEMLAVASMVGSDVAFCVKGGTALATGRGECVQPIPSPPPCWVVLAKPPVSVSTAEIYQGLCLERAPHPDVDAMIQAIKKQDFNKICRLLGNTLESVTLDRVPEISQIKSHMKRMGADGVLMSGSGPTVFGLTQYESRMQRLYNSLKGFCPHVYAVRLCGR
ncbi:4-diphosphocytidyl-2-C-methyl-D-erythritol kinase [Scopulibacillus darangshiensis]|uniref:4-diphosphocytidyl-2-C-methyl-D-erythritol kinase n=1 Tax=Scopulibacillus darangshiensis TaxID=442528 RepID=A0A4R2NLX6_9BACL|nr:4-(cytidine 5'-diphospho)-2-C-methyl-D-erythritol kinase [Scopulibacillus darangshiensis]TCP22551.1 4-diphosphocytidyl-2-C-methyl-D-erythritol kinase [Scopulibacillus darangshiensis]